MIEQDETLLEWADSASRTLNRVLDASPSLEEFFDAEAKVLIHAGFAEERVRRICSRIKKAAALMHGDTVAHEEFRDSVETLRTWCCSERRRLGFGLLTDPNTRRCFREAIEGGTVTLLNAVSGDWIGPVWQSASMGLGINVLTNAVSELDRVLKER